MPQESQGGEGLTSTGSANMEVPTLVSSPVGASGGLPPDPFRGPRAVDGPHQHPTPPSSGRTAASIRLETIWHREQATGISGETSRLLAAGWSNGTKQSL